MNQELKRIKKYYGENMMHLCSKLFPTILENNGKLFKLLSDNFAYSKFLYEDIIASHKVQDFQNFLLSFIEKNNNLVTTDKDPFTLMDEAGYTLYECNNEDEVLKFNKYYLPHERLCTFYMHRTDNHYVFFAVKKNVTDIKRENFSKPKREDVYGTSVISIQFTKGDINSLSIKNRYNHAVDNPDATFSNNLDNIIPGLTDSFQKYYHLNVFPEDHGFDLPSYVRIGGKLYKYNYEINDVFYCPNNIIIDNDKVHKYEKEKYLITDYFIIDLVNKRMMLYDEHLDDDFITCGGVIDKIEILNQNNGKRVIINGNDYFINLKLNKFNEIIAYESNVKLLGNRFLFFNNTIKSFKNNSLTRVGSDFLALNDSLISLIAPNIEKIADNFLEENTTLEYYDLSHLESVGDNFLKSTDMIKLSLPTLKKTGHGFLAQDKYLESIDLPNLKEVGNFFLQCNTCLTRINFPNLEIVGSNFLGRNYRLNEASFPRLKFIGSSFLYNNESLVTLSLPKARDIDNYFLFNNHILKKLSMPLVLTIGNSFLCNNENLEELMAPNLLRVGDGFLENNYGLSGITLESIEMIGYAFLSSNKDIKKVIMPNLKTHGNEFLSQANHINDLDLSSLKEKEEKQLVKKKYF